MEGIQESKEGLSRKIDDSALVVRLYNQDSYISATNFITINLPTGCTMDVRA